MVDDPARTTQQPEEPTPQPRRSLRERVAHVRDRTVELEGKAAERFEQERRRRTWVEICWQAWLRMRQRGGPLLSGGLAYRLFLFMIPAALLVVAVIGAFVDISGETPDQAAHDLGMGAALAATVSQAVSQSEANAWWLALLGLVLMLWAARSAVSALLIVSRIAWDERPSNKISTTRGALVFTGFIFAGSIGSYLASHLLHGSIAASVLLWVLVAAVTIGAALLAMVLLPRAGRPWPVVIPGALFFGVVVRGLVLATGVYFADKISRANDLYGALGIAIVILLWLYLLAWGWVAAQFLNAGIAGVRTAGPAASTEEA
jgi:uncharacterized BrkB/YihY/UPF0761 family membrane protein